MPIAKTPRLRNLIVGKPSETVNGTEDTPIEASSTQGSRTHRSKNGLSHKLSTHSTQHGLKPKNMPQNTDTGRYTRRSQASNVTAETDVQSVDDMRPGLIDAFRQSQTLETGMIPIKFQTVGEHTRQEVEEDSKKEQKGHSVASSKGANLDHIFYNRSKAAVPVNDATLAQLQKRASLSVDEKNQVRVALMEKQKRLKAFYVYRNLHTHDFGDPDLGCLGRLDNGRLEVCVTDIHIRKSIKQNITQDNVLEALGSLKEHKIKDYPIDVYTVFQYGLVPIRLQEMIEEEVSSTLRTNMRRVIKEYITEVLTLGPPTEKMRSGEHPGLAKLWTSQLDFTTKNRKDIRVDDYKTDFETLLNLIDFSAPTSSVCLENVLPFMSPSVPRNVGEPKDFNNAYLTYEASFKHLPQCEAFGGASFRTEMIASAERVPVVILKTYTKNKSNEKPKPRKKTDKDTPDSDFLGHSVIHTAHLLDFNRPYHLLWKAMAPSVSYTLKIKKNRNKEVSFTAKTPSECLQIIENNDSKLDSQKVIDAISRCRTSRQKETIDSNVSISPNLDSQHFGEICIMTRFGPPECNKNILKIDGPTARAYKELELERVRASLDTAEGPIVAPVYHPSLPNVAAVGEFLAEKNNKKNKENNKQNNKNDKKDKDKNAVSEAVKLPTQYEFEAHEYEQWRDHEALNELWHDEQFVVWRNFFNDVHNNESSSLPAEAAEQWKLIEQAYKLSYKASNLEGDWFYDVSEASKDSLPSFLVELWSGNQFHGQIMLPNLTEVKSDKKMYKLGKCEKTDPMGRHTREKDVKEELITGWVWMDPTWRILHPKSGRLNLKIREARNLQFVGRPNVESKPSVYLYQINSNGTWTQVQQYTPFEFGMFFLKDQQSKISAPWWSYEWERNMSEPEPEWINYFGWGEITEEIVEEREVAIHIPPSLRTIESKLDLYTLHLAPDIRQKIVRMCKTGVPYMMRTYIWPQLTGAESYKKQADDYFKSLNDDNTTPKNAKEKSKYGEIETAFDHLVYASDSREFAVYAQIREDVNEMRHRYGLDDSFCHQLEQVLRCLVAFSAARHLMVQVTCDEGSVNIGSPVAYSRSIAMIAHFLMLSHGGLRLNKEHVFWILFALAGADTPEFGEAPFKQYYALHPTPPDEGCRPTFADDIPAQAQDCYYLQCAVEVLNQDIGEKLERAGFHYLEFFYSVFSNLYAGSLPTQSLFRLWDIIFNVVFSADEIIETNTTCRELQEMTAKARAAAQKKGAICCGGPIDDKGTEVRSIKIDPNNPCNIPALSMGRRVLLCLSYSLLVKVMSEFKGEASAREIRAALKNALASLRDPTDLIYMIETGDFILFTSMGHMVVAEYASEAIRKKSYLLHWQKKQNQIVQDIIQPEFEWKGNLNPYQIALSINPNATSILDRYDAKTLSLGLTTLDLRDHLYPLIKYHALFSKSENREFPPGGFGYLVVKLDAVENIGGNHKNCRLEMTFQNEVFVTDLANRKAGSNRFLWTRGSCKFFVITSPPPHIIKVCVKALDGSTIGEHIEVKVDKLHTQGSTFVRYPKKEKGNTAEVVDKNTDANENTDLDLKSNDEELGIYASCYVYTRTREMFMPPLNGQDAFEDSSIMLGGEEWGEPAYHAMDPNLRPEKSRYMIASAQGAADKPVDISTHAVIDATGLPPTEHGMNRLTLENLFFFGAPAITPFVEKLVCQFGKVKNPSNFQEVHNVQVSLREVLASLVLASRGTIVDKAALLFDLFGHYDISKDHSCFAHLFYNHLPYSPDAIREGATLRTLLPSDVEVDTENAVAVPNRITLSAIVACLSTVLYRCLIHVSNLSAAQIAMSLFDHFGDVPRVVGAYITPSNDAKNKKPSTGKNKDKESDVTKQVITHMIHESASTDLYGLNFTKFQSLGDMGIPNPFPESPKTFSILFSEDGTFGNIRNIEVKCDINGKFTSGKGGNAHMLPDVVDEDRLKRMTTYSQTIHINKSHPLVEASFVVDLNSIVLDKYQFITKFTEYDLIGEPIRRITNLDRTHQARNCVQMEVNFTAIVDPNDTSSEMPFRGTSGAYQQKNEKKGGMPDFQPLPEHVETTGNTAHRLSTQISHIVTEPVEDTFTICLESFTDIRNPKAIPFVDDCFVTIKWQGQYLSAPIKDKRNIDVTDTHTIPPMELPYVDGKDPTQIEFCISQINDGNMMNYKGVAPADIFTFKENNTTEHMLVIKPNPSNPLINDSDFIAALNCSVKREATKLTFIFSSIEVRQIKKTEERTDDSNKQPDDDAICVFTWRGQAYGSRISEKSKMQTQEPVKIPFNEHTDDNMLHIYIMEPEENSEPLNSSRNLGLAEVDLTRYMVGVEANEDIPLRNNNGGKIQLKIIKTKSHKPPEPVVADVSTICFTPLAMKDVYLPDTDTEVSKAVVEVIWKNDKIIRQVTNFATKNKAIILPYDPKTDDSRVVIKLYSAEAPDAVKYGEATMDIYKYDENDEVEDEIALSNGYGGKLCLKFIKYKDEIPPADSFTVFLQGANNLADITDPNVKHNPWNLVAHFEWRGVQYKTEIQKSQPTVTWNEGITIPYTRGSDPDSITIGISDFDELEGYKTPEVLSRVVVPMAFAKDEEPFENSVALEGPRLTGQLQLNGLVHKRSPEWTDENVEVKMFRRNWTAPRYVPPDATMGQISSFEEVPVKVQFVRPNDTDQPPHNVQIYVEETIWNFKAKIIEACQQMAEFQTDERLKRGYGSVNDLGEYDVFINTKNGPVELADDKCFLDYPECGFTPTAMDTKAFYLGLQHRDIDREDMGNVDEEEDAMMFLQKPSTGQALRKDQILERHLSGVTTWPYVHIDVGNPEVEDAIALSGTENLGRRRSSIRRTPDEGKETKPRRKSVLSLMDLTVLDDIKNKYIEVHPGKLAGCRNFGYAKVPPASKITVPDSLPGLSTRMDGDYKMVIVCKESGDNISVLPLNLTETVKNFNEDDMLSAVDVRKTDCLLSFHDSREQLPKYEELYVVREKKARGPQRAPPDFDSKVGAARKEMDEGFEAQIQNEQNEKQAEMTYKTEAERLEMLRNQQVN